MSWNDEFQKVLYSCTPDLGHGPQRMVVKSQLKNGRQMKCGD